MHGNVFWTCRALPSIELSTWHILSLWQYTQPNTGSVPILQYSPKKSWSVNFAKYNKYTRSISFQWLTIKCHTTLTDCFIWNNFSFMHLSTHPVMCWQHDAYSHEQRRMTRLVWADGKVTFTSNSNIRQMCFYSRSRHWVQFLSAIQYLTASNLRLERAQIHPNWTVPTIASGLCFLADRSETQCGLLLLQLSRSHVWCAVLFVLRCYAQHRCTEIPQTTCQVKPV